MKQWECEQSERTELHVECAENAGLRTQLARYEQMIDYESEDGVLEWDAVTLRR